MKSDKETSTKQMKPIQIIQILTKLT